ncbi:hypothetical protein WJX73_002009 [Symbiochloris irregularis]|uniref:Expansin-like EG45 domain-containing protein n=1 Tax=Symbiochloris irregularis TaxID=706552 RepID=A0AAW1NZC1_9CHLO
MTGHYDGPEIWMDSFVVYTASRYALTYGHQRDVNPWLWGLSRLSNIRVTPRLDSQSLLCWRLPQYFRTVRSVDLHSEQVPERDGQASRWRSCNGQISTADGWTSGRATFYGGTESYLSHYASRGPPPSFGFGTPLYGSCDYASQRGNQGQTFQQDFPFPVDQVAALANINPDYPGSCGRCYEIRCTTGVVPGNYTSAGVATPYPLSETYIQPGLDLNTLVDDYGRHWAGNPGAADNEIYTLCWNNTLGLTTEASSIYVTIADNCPCSAGGAYASQNTPCCGNVNHFDLSFFAFEKLAHPAYGQMPLEYRPVDCTSKVPLGLLPGYIDETVYVDNIQTGWSWDPYSITNKLLQVPGAGIDSSNATCLTASAGGGLTLTSREADQQGYQPFISSNATTLSFYATETPSDDFVNGNSVPDLQVNLANNADQYYCQSRSMTSLSMGPTSNGLTQLSAPLTSFGDCDLSRITTISFQNTGTSNINFCLDQIELTGGQPPSHLTSLPASPQGDYPGPVTPNIAEAVTS